MADVERSIVIRLKGDLTPDAFASARAELQKLGLQLDTTRQGGAALANQFKETKGSVDPLTESFARMTAAFSAGNLIDRGVLSLINLGEQVVVTGAHLYDLNNTTGVSIQQLQTLSYEAAITGGSIEGVSSAIEMLEQKLGKGDSGATAGIRALGLNLQQFLAESPGDQITDLANAFAAMTDPEERAAAASELFGRGWKTILPTLLAVSEDGGNAITNMSDEAVHGLKLLDDAWTTVTTNIKNSVGEDIGEIGTLIEWYRTLKVAAAPLQTGIEGLTQSIANQLPILAKGAAANATWGTGIGLATTNAHGFTDAAQRYIDAQTEAAKAAAAHAKAVSDLADAFTGKKLADSIQLTADAVTKAGGASNLSSDGLAELDKQLVKYVQDGGKLPPVLEDAYIAQGLWAKNLDTTTGSMLKLLATFPTFQLVPKNIAADVDKYLGTQVREDITNLSQTLDYLRDHGMLTSQMLQQIAADAVDLSKKGGTLDANLQDAVITTGAWTDGLIATNKQTLELIKSLPSIELPKPVTDSWSEFVDVLSDVELGFRSLGHDGSAAMQDLSQALSQTIGLVKQFEAFQKLTGSQKTLAGAGATAGGVVGDISAIQSGSVAGGIESGAETGLGIATMTGMGLAAGAATMGVGAAVVGGIALYKHLTASAGRDLVTQFASSMGGFDALHTKLDELTAAGEADGEALWVALTQGVGKNNPQQAQAAIDAINASFSKYSSDIDAANSNLETLMGNLAQAGIKVPAELDPMLSKLISSGDLKTATGDIGQLTEALTGYQSALGDDSNFQKIASDAQSIGLAAGDMNATFKQGADDASADQIAAQWQELLPYVNNADVLAQKYLGSAQQMVTDALAAGTTIPSSMQPIIESLEKQGLLVDQNGVKLDDLSGVTFKDDPLTTALDKLNETLDLIFKNLTDSANPGGAFDQFSSAGEQAAKEVGKAFAGIPTDVDVTFGGGSVSPGGGGAGLGDDSGVPVADAPIRPVLRGGLVRVNPGDIVGMPSRTPGYGSPTVIHVHNYLDGQEISGFMVDATNTALAQGRIQVPARAVTGRGPFG